MNPFEEIEHLVEPRVHLILSNEEQFFPNYGTGDCTLEYIPIEILGCPWFRLIRTSNYDEGVVHNPGMFGIKLDKGIEISNRKSPDSLLDSMLDYYATIAKHMSEVTHVVPIMRDCTHNVRSEAHGQIHSRETKDYEQRDEGMNDQY